MNLFIEIYYVFTANSVLYNVALVHIHGWYSVDLVHLHHLFTDNCRLLLYHVAVFFNFLEYFSAALCEFTHVR